MIQALIDLAKRHSLHLVEVYNPADRANDIKAFQNLGFEIQSTCEDYYMLPDGELRDVVHMILRLRNTAGEF
jgi:hypothetical protein